MLESLTLKPESFGLDISDLSLKIIKLKKREKIFYFIFFWKRGNRTGDN